jgi:hypothetical protein
MGVQKIIQLVAFVSLVSFAAYAAAVDAYKRQNEISYEDSAVVFAPGASNALRKSVLSAVRVISTPDYFDREGATATSTGTYFSHNNTDYVITSAHSIIGDCFSTMIIADEYMFSCTNFVSLNTTKDIAVMEVEEIFNRKPISISDILQTDEVSLNTGVHQKTYYTGYPQAMGPFTFEGMVVSHQIKNDLFFINSYAWAGSSGSGVFNSDGKLMGIITAVSVANTEYGVDVMEDLIIVTSIDLLDLQSVL